MLLSKPERYSSHKLLNYLFKQLEVNVTNKALEEILEEHRKYGGSIRGIKEVLNDFNIESKIYRVDYNDLLEIKCPIIAHFETDPGSFVVINECSESEVKYFDSKDGFINNPVKDFNRKWSGVVLVPLTDPQSGDPEYQHNIKLEKQERQIKTVLISAISICLILIAYSTVLFPPDQIITWLAFILCKIAGIIVCVMIVRIESGYSDPFIKRICINSECEKVLHSRGSRIFSWLSMGDIGMIYFTGGFLSLAINHPDVFPVLSILSLLNLTAIPFTFYSAFYQWKVAKALCLLCCTVIVLLWCEFILGLFTNHGLSSINFSDILYVTIIYLITITLWLLIRSYIRKASSANSYKTVLSRIKKDVEIFNSILTVKDNVPELFVSNEITMGNTDAPFTLMAIISPSCHSCNQLFSEIKTYSKLFPERMKIVLRFKGSDAEQSDLNKVIDWIISLNLSGESSGSLELYESWNEMKLCGIRQWEERNHLLSRSIIPEAVQLRHAYATWISSLDIIGTPAMIFNNKILPIYYSFNDIKYLINRLYEKRDFQ